MNLTYYCSSRPGEPTRSSIFTFLKNIFVCEVSSSRVDLLQDTQTKALVVQKEYTIKQYEDRHHKGTSDDFIKKCEAEIGLVLDMIGHHPHVCELVGWFRGSWPGGVFDPESNINFILLYKYYTDSKFEITHSNIRTWTHGVLSGLAHLHSKNLIFTNFKIDNVIFDKDTSQAILIDFGDLTVHNKAYPYAAEGSGIYKAPEQITGVFDFRADVYSVGLALVQFCFGGQPIALIGGERRRLWWETLKQRNTPDYQFWCDSFPELKPPLLMNSELEDFIFQLTRYDPNDRLNTEQALAHPYMLEARV